MVDVPRVRVYVISLHHNIAMLVLFLSLIILRSAHGKFLTDAQDSAFVLLRHVRLPTNDEQYQIRCPYSSNHLVVQLLNYSNAHCFNLYSVSGNNICQQHQSPCDFHAKSIPLRCDSHSYSEQVDVSYQCSYKYVVQSCFSHCTRSHAFVSERIFPRQSSRSLSSSTLSASRPVPPIRRRTSPCF